MKGRKLYQHILVPLAGPKLAEAALKEALSQAHPPTGLEQK
jgi:hypothetical protein